MPATGSLAERLMDVRERIARAASRAKREPAEVGIVAVTKYAGPEQIRELIRTGIADLGENRVQQLTQRAAQINEFHQRLLASGTEGVAARLRWHMIGHLQRNKVRQVLPVASVIHSIDSLRLAETIDDEATRTGRRVPVLLQVNASEEPQKFGVAVGAAVHLAEMIAGMKGLQLCGLMTMAAYGATETEARLAFSRTRDIFEELRFQKIGGSSLRILSMGMSEDFEWAVLEGSTLVRVGSAVFGQAEAGPADASQADNDDGDEA